MEAVVAGIVPSELGSAVVNSCGDLKTEGLWWEQAGGHQRGSADPEFPTAGSQEQGKCLTAAPIPAS